MVWYGMCVVMLCMVWYMCMNVCCVCYVCLYVCVYVGVEAVGGRDMKREHTYIYMHTVQAGEGRFIRSSPLARPLAALAPSRTPFTVLCGV